MTNREFDEMMRTSAGQEVFHMTEHAENRIRQTIQEHSTAKKIRRFTARTALVAALIVLLLAATALAVSNLPGVVETMKKIGWGASDERMEHIQQQTAQPQEQVYELPDVQFTLSEIIYDGNHLYAAVHVSPKEESNVVLTTIERSPNGYYGADELTGDTIPEGTKTIAEVAKERGARIVSADVSVDALRSDGRQSANMDYTTNADGSYDFVFDLERVTTDESGYIPLELFGCQRELTDEGVMVENSWIEERWKLSIPAPVEPLTTPVPTPAEPTRAVEQTEGALRVLGFEDTRLTEAYHAAYPDKQLAYVMPSDEITQADWDVCYTDTGDALFEKLMQEKSAFDLSGSEALSAWISRLHEPIRDAVSQDGKLCAVPVELYQAMNGDYMFTRELRFIEEVNPWKKAGFTDADMPETMDGLFDLIEKYAAIPKKERGEIILNYHAVSARSWLLELVMDLYVAQKNGAPATFQTDELRALLTRMNQAADLLKGEQEIGYQILENSDLLQGAEHAVPLRLFDTSPRRVSARLNVLIVNPQSPRTAEAVRFAELATDAMIGWETIAKMDAHITYEELDELALAESIEDAKKDAAWCQAEADKAPDELSRKEWLENAKAQLESIDYIQEKAKREGAMAGLNLIYPEAFEAYRNNLTPALHFGKATLGAAITDGETYAALQKSYLTGKIDTDTFLGELDGLLP